MRFDRTNTILIQRLLPLLGQDPFWTLGIARTYNYNKIVPEPSYLDDARDERSLRYHLRRVRYFRDLFRKGARVDPIIMDNICHGGHVTGIPAVLDGHHRLCGAILADADKIRASYSGRVDVLTYLRGIRKTVPEIG